jgi:hypothetical protein
MNVGNGLEMVESELELQLKSMSSSSRSVFDSRVRAPGHAKKAYRRLIEKGKRPLTARELKYLQSVNISFQS